MLVLHDLVESNGKTIRQNNMAKEHNIPLGTLVEVKFHQWLGHGACQKIHARLFVVGHNRDCDGTPLYSIGRWTSFPKIDSHSGFTEDRLSVIEITQDLLDGYGCLEWEDE